MAGFGGRCYRLQPRSSTQPSCMPRVSHSAGALLAGMPSCSRRAACKHSLHSHSAQYCGWRSRGTVSERHRCRRVIKQHAPQQRWALQDCSGVEPDDTGQPALPTTSGSTSQQGLVRRVAGSADARSVVPWGWTTIAQVMGLWLMGFLTTGNWLIPTCLDILQLEIEDLSFRGHAVLHLLLDMSELGLTLAVLWLCLRLFRPRERGLFPISWRLGMWVLQVAAACVSFPLIDHIAHLSLSLFPDDQDMIAARLEQSLCTGDAVTSALYFAVVSMCAPVWEEVMFRGFLLTSLTRYMSPIMAVVASSVAFALCHFSVTRFVPLFMLGVLMGVVFLNSKNMLAPIALHSLWNLYILLQFAWRSMAFAAA